MGSIDSIRADLKSVHDRLEALAINRVKMREAVKTGNVELAEQALNELRLIRT